MREITEALAKALNVRGLMNVQFAVRHEEVYLIEVNPRASRTVPFISKTTGSPLAKIAALVQSGKTLAELGITDKSRPAHFAAKESVMPFNKFPGVDTILGPEMRSTGEVMGIAPTFGEAFYKAELGAGNSLPATGKVFISVRDNDKRAVIPLAWEIHDLGYKICSTRGTGAMLQAIGIPVEVFGKVQDQSESVLDHWTIWPLSSIRQITAGRAPMKDVFVRPAPFVACHVSPRWLRQRPWLAVCDSKPSRTMRCDHCRNCWQTSFLVIFQQKNAVIADGVFLLRDVRYLNYSGNITFHSCAMSTTVQPLAAATSSPLSNFPICESRS